MLDNKTLYIILIIVLSVTIILTPLAIYFALKLAKLELENIYDEDNNELIKEAKSIDVNIFLKRSNVKQLSDTKKELLKDPKTKALKKILDKKAKLESQLSTVKLSSFQSDGSISSNDIIDIKGRSSEELKDKFDYLKKQEKPVTNHYTIVKPLQVGGSIPKGKKLQNKVSKDMLKCFINEVNLMIKNEKKTTYSPDKVNVLNNNLDIIFSDINQANSKFLVKLDESILKLAKEKLLCAIELELAKEEEKEIAKELKEQQKEEARAQKEIEALKAKNLKELEKAHSNLVEYKTRYENSTGEEKQKALEAFNKWNDIYKNAKDDLNNIEEFSKNYNVGYVYVIENNKSFKGNFLKIGMTRRLDPYERFKELSNASVPYNFEPLLLIKSENAYKLEKELHNEFNLKRVNKVNKRKEHFYVTKEQVINYLNKTEIPYDIVS